MRVKHLAQEHNAVPWPGLKPHLPQLRGKMDVFLKTFVPFFIDTLGVLARTIGPDNFMPLADECIQLGLVRLSSFFIL